MAQHTRWIVVGMATLMLLTTASGAVAAQGSTDDAASASTIEVGEHDIVIRDVTVRVTDLHVVGPGLPDESIDRASYTIDEATVSTSEFSIGVGDRTIQVGPLSLTMDDVGVTLENVSTASPDS